MSVPIGEVYRWCMARTNIDIDEEAVEAVMRRYQLKSKRDAVNFALRAMAGEPLSLEEARALRGSGTAVFAALGATHVAPWIGVVGTVTGAVIAHSAAARYGFLEIEYARTADELRRIITRHSVEAASEENDDRLVRKCEHVISYQNEAWMTELISTRDEDPQLAMAPAIVE